MKLKKLLILLSVVLLTLTACGNDDSQLSTATTTETVSEPTEDSIPDYDKQPEDYLPDNLKDIENKTEEEIEEIFQEMEKENYEKFVEEQQKAEQETSQPDNNTTGNQSQSEPEFNGNPEWGWDALFTEEEIKEHNERMEQAIENAPNIEVSQEEIDQFIKSNQ
jgi:TolA-binding protein